MAEHHITVTVYGGDLLSVRCWCGWEAETGTRDEMYAQARQHSAATHPEPAREGAG